MGSFADLPDEILLIICKHVNAPAPNWDGQRDLFSLCLVSRRFYKIFQPSLYREVCPFQLGPFMQTIIRKPELAAEVKFLNLMNCSLGEEEDELLPSLAPIAMLAGMEIETANDPLTSIIDFGRQYSFGFYIDLMFTKLSNLEELEAGVGRKVFEGEFLLERLRLSPDHQILPALRKVTFMSWAAGGHDATAIVPVLAMSEVRQLHLQLCTYIDFEVSDRAFLLEEVVLDGCLLEANDLRPLIQRCSSLRAFSFRALRRLGPVIGQMLIIDANEIVDILEPIETQLEKLCLHVYCDIGQDQEGDEDGDVLRSLTQFSNLRELKICQHDLTNGNDQNVENNTAVEVSEDEESEDDDESLEDSDGYRFIHKLPASLERLTIFETNHNLRPELKKLAECAPTCLPRLKYICHSGLEFSSLVPEFEAIGIELKHLSSMPSPETATKFD